jgi:hypothetical protein
MPETDSLQLACDSFYTLLGAKPANTMFQPTCCATLALRCARYFESQHWLMDAVLARRAAERWPLYHAINL